MPITAVDTDRLYRKIASQLSELIANGEFAPGQKLPAERELAQQLRVSRSSVREALIALEIEGKVEVRVGSGIYVTKPRPMLLTDPEEVGEGPFELIQARRVMEGEIAAIAAREATSEDVAAIRAALHEMNEATRSGRNPDPSDRSFHLAVAAATHNAILVSMARELWDRGRGAVWRQMEKHFQTADLRSAVLRDHLPIAEAIAAGDARAARKAMHNHLERVDREFARGWEQLKENHQKTAATKTTRR